MHYTKSAFKYISRVINFCGVSWVWHAHQMGFRCHTKKG